LGGVAPLLAVTGWGLVRRPGRLTGIGLAVLAGLSYGSASLVARAVSAPGVGWTGETPALVVLVLHALQGVVFVTAAMRHTSVTTGTAVLFVTETVGPAALGFLFLGDRIAAGTALIAVGGCACLVVATAVLAASPSAAPEPVAERAAPEARVVVPAPRRSPEATAAHRAPAVIGQHAVGRHRRS
jgi:drug/metabolite transporter (DMT)-like permease